MKLFVVSFVVCTALCCSVNGYSIQSNEPETGYYSANNAFEIPMSLQQPQPCYKYDARSAPVEQPEDIKFTFNFDLHKPVASAPKNVVNTYDASVQALPTVSEMSPKRVFGYVIQKPVEETSDYMPSVPSHCGCRECAASSKASMMLPVQYNRKRRSAADVSEARKKLKEKYTEKINGHIDTLKTFKVKTVDTFEKTKQYAQERVAKIKSSIRPILSTPTEFVQGFMKNFEKPVAPRERRSVAETSNAEPLVPTLKVVENPAPCCPVIEDLKENCEYRSRVAQPEVLQYMPEVDVNAEDASKQKRCPYCNGDLSDSVCKTCAKVEAPAQPQYFRYVEGVAVPFVPGTVQSSSSSSSSSKRSAQSDFYVYDRFGHKYEENNGNLRLIAPEFAPADPQTAQPNIEAFANIMNANAEIMHDLNPHNGDRMVAPVTDLAADALHFVHEVVRRDAKNQHREEDAREPPKGSNKSKSHYQIIPIRHDNRNGSLIAKIYSNNGRGDYSENDRRRNGNQEPMDDTAKSASLQKTRHNNNEYEILTIDARESADSAEEFDRIMKFLHSGRMKRNA